VRLIKRLDAIAAAAAAREAERVAGADLAVCWSVREARVDDGDLEAGDYVACDVRYLDEGAAALDALPLGSPARPVDFTALLSITERVTRDERDLGLVYDAAGVRVGRVVAVDGSMLTFRSDAEETELAEGVG
jgi:hypothetical protein